MRRPRCLAEIIAALAIITGALAASARADQYAYDAMSRLTQVTYTSGGITMYTYDPNGNILSIVSSLAVTGVEEEESQQRRLEFALGRTTPNPSSGPMTLRFSIPARDRVVLRIFDVSGRLVTVPVDATLDAGPYTARINTPRMAGGVYFYRLEWNGRSLARRFVVIP